MNSELRPSSCNGLHGGRPWGGVPTRTRPQSRRRGDRGAGKRSLARWSRTVEFVRTATAERTPSTRRVPAPHRPDQPDHQAPLDRWLAGVDRSARRRRRRQVQMPPREHREVGELRDRPHVAFENVRQHTQPRDRTHGRRRERDERRRRGKRHEPAAPGSCGPPEPGGRRRSPDP